MQEESEKSSAKSKNSVINSPPASSLQDIAIKAGWLMKRGGGKISRAWKHRWIVLANNTLFYYKHEKCVKPQGIVEKLTEYSVIDETTNLYEGKNIFPFNLVSKLPSRRTYFMAATNPQEKNDWMEVLKGACSGRGGNKKALEIEEKLRKREFAIPASDLEWGGGTNSILGKGSSGVVKRGLWLKTTEVAIKALNNLPEFTDESEMFGFYKEIEMLSQLRHPNIVPMFGYCKKDGYICLVTEFVKGGNLSEVIHNKEIQLDFGLMLDLCLSIAAAMVYLHNKRVIHRDLKPGNILVEHLEYGNVKVCDFGLSTITQGHQDGQMTKNTFGSPSYAAPELPTESHTEKVDVYSFAIIMWELYTRERPWSNVSYAWQISDLVAKGVRPSIPPNSPLENLIRSCWDLNPDIRPSFAEIHAQLEKLKSMLPAPFRQGAQRSIRTMSQFGPMEGNSGQFTNLSNPLFPSLGNLANTRISSDSFFIHPVQQAKPIITEIKSSPLNEFRTPEQLILEAFQKKDILLWEEFCPVLRAAFESDEAEMLRFCIVGQPDDGLVKLSSWQNFVTWFSPLVKFDSSYQTKSSTTDSMGYNIKEIVDIVGQSWFFGFISAEEAKKILFSLPTGSFLFRFSSKAGQYALSVNYGQVGHWRIIAEKKAPGPPILVIDDHSYASFQSIVETHRVGGDSLVVKGSGITSCYLRFPVKREDYYKAPKTQYDRL